MSSPTEEAQENTHDGKTVVPVAENNTTPRQDFVEFSVPSNEEAKDQVFITVPNLAQPTGLMLRANKKARKVSNHPLGKAFPREPLHSRAQIRARDMKYALTTRVKKNGYRFVINTKDTWSSQERIKLITALKKHGIFDMHNLCKEVPTKDKSQILDFIDAAQTVTENTLNERIKGRNPCAELSNPIAQWLYAMEAATNNRQDRFSAFNLMLPKVFLYISKYVKHPDPVDCDGINYSAAYEYIYHMLSGQPGRELTTETMRFIRKTLLNLSLRARNGTYEQLDFIKGIETTSTGLVNQRNYEATGGSCKASTCKTPSEILMRKALLDIILLPTANPLKVPMKVLEFPGVRK